jgi:decaprenylphospho-beta-D-erythro-pentofuranosid-2-ulose 2-reductase
VQNVLVIGAASAIAQATARCYAGEGASLHLVGRSASRLEAVAADLKVRGARQVTTSVLDVDHLAAHAAALDEAEKALGAIDVALIAHGTLPEQPACSASTDVSVREFHTNAVATIALLNALGQRLERAGQGSIAVISSVAGDRGRQSNYLYGAAKSAVSTFAAGLRNRMNLQTGGRVHVMTVKPGFVDTPMTAQFKKGALWATPAAVGEKIHAGIARRRDVLYVPGFWRLIMFVIRSVPEFLFKRLKL